ncbi:MAG: carbamoyl phosphate synthase small subunit [Deltaproteobacteria bacterium]|nr:carbamoyl phosphate synthase small subunit [Deltaproteobacteria bacterium]
MIKEAHLVLADGTRFTGQSFGAEGAATGEAVFTTGMTGYEEVLTDPSYCGQIVTMTAPQIGNTGINIEDSEAQRPALRGFVVHEMAAVGTEDPATLHDRAKAAPPMTGQNLTGEVTTPEAYQWTEGSGVWSEQREGARPWHVVAMDFGVKLNILRCLVDEGCKVTVVPASATAEEVLALDPDGIFLSNGPGDPAAVSGGIATVRELLGQRPLFGICLGHQLMSLALGGQSYKLKFGHRGLNQPVKDLKTGHIEVTTQNHGFCVDVDSLKDKCELTHLHLNDDTCEGIEHVETGAFSVQYHPEAAAGPHDSRYLFRRFTDAIARARS